MRIWRSLQLLGPLSGLLLLPGAQAPIRAQRADYLLRENQAREVAEQTVRKADSGSRDDLLRTRRREDLEELLSTIEENKPARNVYFYEIHSPPRTGLDPDSVWVVAVARSTREVYELYGFEASGGSNGSSQEFDRLIAQLKLSVPKEKATSFASFFLGCCVGGEFSETVLDEEGLRHAVQRYYFATYGAVRRALEAYVQWWEGLQVNAPAVAPTVRFEDGRYHIVLKRILLVVGTHPQLQQWDLEISPDGKVRILAVQSIFPKGARWLFLDSP